MVGVKDLDRGHLSGVKEGGAKAAFVLSQPKIHFSNCPRVKFLAKN